MKTKKFLSSVLGLVICLYAGVASAITTGGNLTADETWSGEVTLSRGLTVPDGITLTILPGTTVRGNHTLVVEGVIDARGTAAEPIRFDNVFAGLQLIGRSRGTFEHTIISGSSHAFLTGNNSELHFSDGVITQTSDTSIVLRGTAEIASSRIVSNKHDVIQVLNGTAHIHHNEIHSNGTPEQTGPLVRIQGGEVTFDHNSVAHNHASWAIFMDVGAIVTNNIFFANGGAGVFGNNVQIFNNLVFGHDLDLIAGVTSINGVSADPRVVSATDLRLRFDSPAIGKDQTGGDLGAHAFVTGPLHHLAISPANATVEAGGTVAFQLLGEDELGNPVSLAGQNVVWQSSVGSINSSTGVLTPTQAGSFPAAVTATVGALSITASVTVTPGPAAQVVVSPGSLTLVQGGTSQLSATVKDAHGNERQDTVIWSVSPAAGTIAANGQFVAGSTLGSFPDAITASAGGVSGKASVTIVAEGLARLDITPTSATLAPGGQITFVVEGHDALGDLIDVTPSWSAGQGGTITSAGVFTAGTLAGTFVDTVTVSAGGIVAKATVVVEPGPVAQVIVSPAAIVIAPGGNSAFAAQVLDAHGNLRSDAVDWSLTTAGVGSIDASGRFTAGTTAGDHPDLVVARVGQVIGHARVTISAGALHHLVLSPASAKLAPEAAIDFAIEGFDADGNRVELSPTWSVLQGGGTISTSGRFTAGHVAGRFVDTVQVSAGGLNALASVEVIAGPLVSLTVKPAAVTLASGASVVLAAEGRDAAGNLVELTDVQWSVDPAAGTITPDGKLTAGSQAGEWPEGLTLRAAGVTTHASIRVTVDTPAVEDGCGCSVGRRSTGSAGGGVVLLLLLGGLVLRRKRR